MAKYRCFGASVAKFTQRWYTGCIAEVSTLAKLYTRREAKERRMKYEALAGVADGMGLLLSIGIIIACVILVGALATWILGDAQTTFATIFETIEKAIIVPTQAPSEVLIP